MLEVKCKYCGKKKRVKPSDIEDPSEYHCRNCHTEYLKEKRENGKMHWDRSHLNKLNQLAMLNGQKSIFLQERATVSGEEL